ncbi:MAG TPA: hypothetical protein VK903_14600 [Propionicimonas sp.]|nr:hypothetical protein [Propionicimonas sp.]
MKARVMVAGLATAGLLALTGCGGSPLVAAYVGGPGNAVNVQVTQAEVDQVASAIAGTTSDEYDTGVSFAAAVMQIKVQSAVVAQVAKDKAITVTDEQRNAFYASQELYAPLAQNPATRDFMISYANTATILSDEAAATAFGELMAKTPIRVNPRFGVWDDTTGSLVDGSSGSLSEAATPKG